MRILALLGVVTLALAATGGPDSGGYVYADSAEAIGPSHQWLDTTGGTTTSLADDGTVELSLPFAFSFYGTDYTTVTASANGALFFAGAQSSPITDCPGSSTSWTGVAAFAQDLGPSTLSYTTLGTYPYRTLVVSWDAAPHATYGGEARFQAWLLEGRNEVVVVLDDVDFGDAAVDGGATAIVGVSSGTAGLDWSCTSAFAGGQSAWFGSESARPARATVYTSEVVNLYSDESFAYAGSALHAIDLDADGVDEALVGAPDLDAGVVYGLYRPTTATSLLDAEALFVGDADGDELGAAFGNGDIDGDGTTDLGIGAPGVTGTQVDSGAVYLYAVEPFSGTVATTDSFLDLQGPPTGRGALGSAVVLGDLDGDGYDDLAASAPTSDTSATDAGEVVLLYGGAGLAGSFSTSAADARVLGAAAGDRLGADLAAADFDLDGTADLALGASGDDTGASNAGAVYLVPGGTYAGTSSISSLATCTVNMTQASAQFGAALTVTDLDSSGLFDLIVGSPGYDDTYTNGGALYGFSDLALGCPALAAADFVVTGTTSAGQLGGALTAGDVNGDGLDDLVAGAENDNSYTAAGGAAYMFLSAPSGSTTAASADHRVIGSTGSGAAGSAVAVANDGASGTLLVGAPSATGSYSGEGAVASWTYGPDFEDDDSDGFVSASTGGNDCDDDDATAYPGGTETLADSVDGDCDGFVDGAVNIRTTPSYFEWDVSELGGSVSTTIDFETSTHGDAVTYLAGVTFSGVDADDVVFGAAAVDTLGGSVAGGSLLLEFDEPVDAMSLQLLDPDDDFVLTALDNNGNTVVDGVVFAVSADDRPQGTFRSFTFAAEVSLVELSADGGDSFGLDELWLVNAADTDRDQDGQTDAEGDCDDGDASVYLGGTEVLGNGLDDDCDGVVDAGNATAYGDLASWTAAVGVTPQAVDFEDVSEGEAVTAQYTTLGATFDGTGEGAADVDGTPAVGNRALLGSSTLGVSFTELQPGVAITLLDVDGSVTVLGYVDGNVEYTLSYSASGGQEFVGLGFDYGVDEVLLVVAGDAFGIDDVTFSELGLDDADGDGLTESEGDCDDDDASALPGADETWYDGVDGDCDGADDYDQDGDGYALGEDCDDEDDSSSPAAEEVWYDGVDGDCAGDDDYDADGDGYGVGSGSFTDCDDDDASTSPGAEETPYDGVDNDCDEATTDADYDGDGYDGEAAGGDDCDDTSVFVYPGASGEACYDGEDTDCDGSSDNDCDQDGFDSSDYGGDDCDDTDPAVNPDATDTLGDGIDTNCDGAAEYDFDGDGYDAVADGGLDCDDSDGSINPAAADTCYDGVDTDCDGWSDYDCDYDGADSDAYGGSDCDDGDATRYPDATDFPYDGIDHDCDGANDYDYDGDGEESSWYGGTDCDDLDATVYLGAIDACYDGLDTDCDASSDYDCDADGYDSSDYAGADCDDLDATVNPDASEVADDGVDNDCDGTLDESCADCDGDGESAISAGGTDCDDTDPSVYAAAPERYYDGVDANCDGLDDYDQDLDGDRAGAQGGGDCDDLDAAVSSLVEADDCGGGDEDCDGREDEDRQTGDTGTPGDTGDTGDSGDTDTDTDTDDAWRPDPEDQLDPKPVADENACGCSTGAPGVAGLLGAAALVARRKRQGSEVKR